MTYKEPEQNFTKIPNPILDVMGEMSESELKLTMCLVRYTFGYHTDRAQMTYEIMQDRTGMSRGGVYRAIELVEERGFFRRGRKSYWYVNSSQFEPCYVNKEVGNSSDSERKYVGNSSDSEPTKRKEIKENNKTRADESLIAFFEGMTAFTPPYETTDAYAEEWLQPVQAILSQSADYSEAENRLTWAIQEMRRKRYTIKSPKSCLTMALNWHDGPAPSPNGNGRSQPTNGKTSDDVTIWNTVLKHARDGDTGFTDPTMIAAVRAFGWRKLQDIKAGDENFYRKDFLRIYHEQSATTTA